MKKYLKVALFLSIGLLSCKEKNKMEDFSIFPPTSIVIPFHKDEIVHLFPVLRMNSIGLVYDEQWAIATINGENIHLERFPEGEFNSSSAKGLIQKDPELLYVRGNRILFLLNWRQKKVSADFYDISKSVGIGLGVSKIVDYEKGIALSVFNYDGKDQSIHFSFVLDDILNKKRLKEVPISDDYARQFPVYFTPSFVFYRLNYKTPWIALDNDINSVKHPLVDLLNKDPSDSVFAVLHDNMLISEELKHAFIASYSQAAQKDMLFLATWYGDPKVQPIVMDTSAIGPRRLVLESGGNTMSPSGKWVYFSATSEGKLPNTHFIVYLDTALPNGYLPPFKLGIEGKVTCAGWMTNPEGLVLYMDAKLWYYDLSHFDVKKYFSAQ
jgi:hypothetical protein